MMRLKNILSGACISLTWSCYPDATTYHSFLWGMYSVAQGVQPEAATFLDTAFLNDAVPDSLTKSFLVYAYQAKQYSYIVSKKTFILTQCRDPEYLLMLARAYEHVKNQHEADTLYTILENEFPDNAEALYHVVRAHIKGHRFTQGLQAAQRCIARNKNSTASAVFYYIQAQIYQLQNNYDAALDALKQCIALSPNFDQGWFLWALLHEKMNNSLEVQKGYTRFLDVTGTDPVIEKKVLSLLLQEKHHSQSWYDRAIQAYHAQEFSKALLLLSIAEKQQARCDACRILELQILDALNRVDAVCALCTEILTKNTDDEQWLRVIHTLFTKTIYKEELLGVFDAVIARKPHKRLILYALDCALRTHAYKRVLAYYKKLTFSRTDAQLKHLVLYHVGACSYENRDITTVRAIAHEVYAQRYQYAPLLNFAAYYYSKYEKAYRIAQDLVSEALRIDPTNPHYKDTQAYVYLRQGDKQRAAAVLQSLVYEAPLDKKIRNHRKEARL